MAIYDMLTAVLLAIGNDLQAIINLLQSLSIVSINKQPPTDEVGG
jgi:hypothetical protein